MPELYIVVPIKAAEAGLSEPRPVWVYSKPPVAADGQVVMRCVPVEPLPKWVIQTPRGVLGTPGGAFRFDTEERALTVASRFPDGFGFFVRQEKDGD